ncbi:MAG: hypothetical protein IKB96_12490 [Prevotella sp.]|nr:hypothetical protein [Prevotella sp.]
MPDFAFACFSGANIQTKIEMRFNSVYLLSNFKKISLIMAEKEGLHQRLKQAIIWLKQNKNILQLDIAEKMNMTTVGLSRGLARCKEKNDEDFVIKFHQATDEIFSLDWLLYGTGSMFPDDSAKSSAEPAADMLELYAQRIRLVDDLRASLKEELAEVNALRTELQQARDDFRDATYRLTRTLALFTVPTDSPVGLAAESIT